MPRPKARRHYPILIVGSLLISLIGSRLSDSEPFIWMQIPQASAHQVELSAEVGGTLHIEPSDTPRAGEEVLAWFALTRKGGTPISLAECDCRIDIYQQPEQGDDQPILSPVPLAVQGDAAVGALAGIPGAKFTFPAVGSYSLVISGQPKDDAAAVETGETKRFAPFELAFDVTVAAGESSQTVPPVDIATPPAATPAAPVVPTPGRLAQPWIAAGGAALVGLGGWAIATLMRRRH
jgi:hypothetical protein